MTNVGDLRRWAIAPTLTSMGCWSPAAEVLMVGTAIVESVLKYLHQIGGPAPGLWQMEPATHDYIVENWLEYRPYRWTAKALAPFDPNRLLTDLEYMCAMARLLHYRRLEPLPEAEDIESLAEYWKAHFNTKLGKAIPVKFVRQNMNHAG